MAELRALERAGWPKQDELDQKQARLAGLIGELEQEAQTKAPEQTLVPAQAAAAAAAPAVRGPGMQLAT